MLPALGLPASHPALPWQLVFILPGLVVLFYAVAPLVVRHMISVPSTPAYEAVRSDDSDLPSAARARLEELLSALLGSGFTPATYFKDSSTVQGVLAFVVVLTDDARGRRGELVFSIARIRLPSSDYSPSVSVPLKNLNLVIETHYADGFVLQSADASSGDVLPERPNVKGLNFHGLVTDVQGLLTAHRASEERLGHGQVRPSGASEDALGFMVKTHRDVLAVQMKRGIMTQWPSDGKWHLTLRGAYRMTWSELWPAKQISRARQRREARSVLDTSDPARLPAAQAVAREQGAAGSSTR